VTLVNRALTAVFDAVMAPLAWMPAMAGLCPAVARDGGRGAPGLQVDRRSTALAAAKQAMQPAIFEMRLFNDDLVLLFRAQGEVVRHSLTYLRLSLAPTLWLIVPMAVLMLHMEFHFGYAGLAAGEAALVKVRLADSGATGSATLAAPDGIQVETPAVVLPSEREIAWRIRPRKPGSYELRVRMGGTEIGKSLLVSDAVGRRSPVRPDPSLTSQLLNPSEPPVPAGDGLTSIAIDYPREFASRAGTSAAGVPGTDAGFRPDPKGLFGVTM
jgi:hypothetical protein